MVSKGGKPEKIEERKFCKKIRDLGGEVLKQGGQGPYGMGGYNDRLALLPYGTAVFFEFKRIHNGVIEAPKPRQIARHKKLRKLGFITHVVATSARALKLSRIAMRDRGVPLKIRKRFTHERSSNRNVNRRKLASSRR
jgi:hypothetical protein